MEPMHRARNTRAPQCTTSSRDHLLECCPRTDALPLASEREVIRGLLVLMSSMWEQRALGCRLRPDRDPEPVRQFECFAADLYHLTEWSESCGS